MFKWFFDCFTEGFENWRAERRFVKKRNRTLRPMARSRYRSRLVWYVRQLFPLTYWTTYSGCGNVCNRCDPNSIHSEHRFAIWKMWFGHCYRVTDFLVK